MTELQKIRRHCFGVASQGNHKLNGNGDIVSTTTVSAAALSHIFRQLFASKHKNT
jgi:hypothetical protein